MLRKVFHHFILQSIFRNEDNSLPRMIKEFSSKSIRTAEKKMCTWWKTSLNWDEMGELRPHRSECRVGKKNKSWVHSYTLYCTVESQAKQPVSEELIDSDWIKIWCNLEGLDVTKTSAKPCTAAWEKLGQMSILLLPIGSKGVRPTHWK